MLPGLRWSGRRDSNPRHPAWKAGTLPAELHPPFGSTPTRPLPDGGEGRIRTFEARGASDLQSDAFGRFATSPGIAGNHPRISPFSTGFSDAARRLELAKGIEPPTR